MSFIDNIKNRAKKCKAKIVLPEYNDIRVLKAAVEATKEGISNIIIIGSIKEIKEVWKDFDSSGIEIIDPKASELTEVFVNKLVELRKNKGMTYVMAKELLLSDYMYFACMMVKLELADGVVSGACHSTSNTLRPALQIIKTEPKCKLVSAFFLMVVPDCTYGENGTFIFADCGLVQNPSSLELAEIAVSSANSFSLLVQKEPVVALLSHSSKGSASHPDVDKVKGAVVIANNNYPDYKIDGELQLDAAIVPEIANGKAPNSLVAGKANVLIFPDLDAGNIGYKLVQRLGKAEAYGPICQGIASPVNDLSRGCSVEDIIGVIAITAVQAQEKIMI